MAEKEIIARKRGLAPLFRLLICILRYYETMNRLKNANMQEIDVNGALDLRLVFEDALEKLRAAIRHFLSGCLDGIDEVLFLDDVLQLNMPPGEHGEKGGNGQLTVEKLEAWYFSTVARLMDLGVSYTEATEIIPFTDAMKLIEEWRKIRGELVIDRAVAFAGTDIREYVARLNGEKLMSMPEFMQMMKERKEVH